MISTPRISKFVWLIFSIAVIGFVVFWLRGTLFPFIIGGLLAYILHPMVTSIEQLFPMYRTRPGIARVIAIAIVFIIILALIGGLLALVIPEAIRQFGLFLEALPSLFNTARITIEVWGNDFIDRVPEDMRMQVINALNEAGTMLASAGQSILRGTFSAVSNVVTIVIGLAVVPLFLYYVLKDGVSITEGIASLFPAHQRVHVFNVIAVVNNSFSSYVRAQLLLGVVVGVLVFLGLTILNVRFAIVLAIVAGVFELVPIIGPWLGAIPGLIVVLATSPEDFAWVAGLYLGVQLLENAFLVPRIQSRALHVHPILIMVVLVVGSEFAGLWGIILGPPLVAAAKEVYLYFRSYWEHPLPYQIPLQQPAQTIGQSDDSPTTP